MRNIIRCCISCILPCGALDVIRIVHSSGRVEEISHTIRAEEVMKAHPKHILKKPSSRSTTDVDSPCGPGPTIVVVPPDAQLQRGKIYFLIPVHEHQSSSSTKKKKNMSSKKSSSPSISSSSSTVKRKRREQIKSNSISMATAYSSSSDGDKYLSEILSEKVISNSHRDKRRGRVAVWRPHLQSITETLSEAPSSDH